MGHDHRVRSRSSAKAMKRAFTLGCLVFALLLSIYWLSGSHDYEPPPSPPNTGIATPPAPTTRVSNIPPPTTSTGTPLAAELHLPDRTLQQDVDTLRQIIQQYFEAIQNRPGPPIGDDADLARVLKGRNPLKLIVVPTTHPIFSADGRMRDRFGTPYHIHARSRTAIDIRSAGPDRKLFTEDDVVSQGGAPR